MTLKDARDLVGLSQIALDRAAGLPKGTIHDLEAGRSQKPSHATVTRIVRALHAKGLVGLSPDQLFPVPNEVSS